MTKLDKIVVLLQAMPAEACEGLLRQMGAEAARSVRERLRRAESRPPNPAEVDKVFSELDQLLRQVQVQERPDQDQLTELLNSEQGTAKAEPGAQYRQMQDALRGGEPPPDADDAKNPIDALRAQEPETIYFALEDEQPRTIAVILNLLTEKRAAQLLKLLPSSLRCRVSLQVAGGQRLSLDVVERMARVIVEKCTELTVGHLQSSDQSRVRKLAALLQRLDEPERAEILTAMDREDPATAARLRERLTGEATPGDEPGPRAAA